MNEREWAVCGDPGAMLGHLGDRAGERKLRLFAVACCRRVWLSLDARSREAVRTAEDFADGRVKPATFRNACRTVASHLIGAIFPPDWVGVSYAVRDTASYCVARVPWGQARDREPAAQADLLRDIVGPVVPLAATADPGWLAWAGGTVPALAEGIYRERTFDRLPILADALEDAGCADAAILSHLRGPGTHVRGCWALDLLLGKG